MKYIAILSLVFIFSSCNNKPSRSEIIEENATEYLKQTTHPMSDYVIVGKSVESDDTLFIGFVGYRCSIGIHHSIYKVIFIGMHGDSVVYVGTDEETAKYKTNK